MHITHEMIFTAFEFKPFSKIFDVLEEFFPAAPEDKKAARARLPMPHERVRRKLIFAVLVLGRYDCRCLDIERHKLTKIRHRLFIPRLLANRP